MILLPDGHKLVQSASELPVVGPGETIYLDVETTMGPGREKEFADYPYLGDRICGIAFLRDEDEKAFYIPIRHKDTHWNVDLGAVQAWLRDVLANCRRWVNHNIKFDAHFCAAEGAFCQGEMIDTLTLMKIIDTDRMTYSLKPLSDELFKLPATEQDRVHEYLKGVTKKGDGLDFAKAPADLLGWYACGDVIRNRMLWRWLQQNRPDQVLRVWDNEIALTQIFFDMEYRGNRSNKKNLRIEQLKSLRKIISLSDRIKEITGEEFTNSAGHIYNLLINQYGLPVLEYDDKTGNPTFDKKALVLYSAHPAVIANPELAELVKSIGEIRREMTFKGLFLDTYLQYIDDNEMIHPSYNQIVRTGRTSCARPNFQQLNARARQLIIPRDGYAFLSCDASQIEFRLIVHYIEDQDAIEAYRNDPKTDFHQWVADLCHFKRKAGKTMNFAAGYGAGVKRVTSGLAGDPDIMEEIGRRINDDIAAGLLDEKLRNQEYQARCEARAREIYTMYHERFPGIKRMSEYAARAARVRGYVFNGFGRRRHLPVKAAHKAFNSVIQGTAMDYIKDRMIALHPRYNRRMRELDITICAEVHDEILFEGPSETLSHPAVQLEITRELEKQSIPFKVPFLWDTGYSAASWHEAKGT